MKNFLVVSLQPALLGWCPFSPSKTKIRCSCRHKWSSRQLRKWVDTAEPKAFEMSRWLDSWLNYQCWHEQSVPSGSLFIRVQVRDLITLFVYIYFLMKKLIPFTPQGLKSPVALVSPNCSQLVLDVLENSWDKTSSGLGSHTYVDSQSITDSDELQEYWEEYSV